MVGRPSTPCFPINDTKTASVNLQSRDGISALSRLAIGGIDYLRSRVMPEGQAPHGISVTITCECSSGAAVMGLHFDFSRLSASAGAPMAFKLVYKRGA